MRALVLGIVLAAPCACGPITPAQKAQADIDTFRSESTADKLLERGRAFASVGDATRAEEYLAAALDQGADPKEVVPLLMSVCISAGRYRAAIQYAETHLRRHPDDARTRLVVGTLYAALGDKKPAHENLELAVEQRPNDPNAHYALAVLARDGEQDPVEADKHFREYLRLAPTGAHADEARDSLLKRVP